MIIRFGMHTEGVKYVMLCRISFLVNFFRFIYYIISWLMKAGCIPLFNMLWPFISVLQEMKEVQDKQEVHCCYWVSPCFLSWLLKYNGLSVCKINQLSASTIQKPSRNLWMGLLYKVIVLTSKDNEKIHRWKS